MRLPANGVLSAFWKLVIAALAIAALVLRSENGIGLIRQAVPDSQVKIAEN